MAYLIEFADRAARDLEALDVEKNAAESQAASRWYNGLEEAVYALANYPRRCPVATEAGSVSAKRTSSQVLLRISTTKRWSFGSGGCMPRG